MSTTDLALYLLGSLNLGELASHFGKTHHLLFHYQVEVLDEMKNRFTFKFLLPFISVYLPLHFISVSFSTNLSEKK